MSAIERRAVDTGTGYGLPHPVGTTATRALT